tara:strand:- start:288 stop:695 length:408 start_codon:yes stop_codon:yes gene_type:complete
MYAGINTIIMRLNLNRYFQFFSLIFLFLFSSNTISNEKSITYECTGLSEFELIGASGLKEEVKIKEFTFVNGILHDLNNIKCDWANNNIKCESNFLNVRRLNINLNNNEVSDYISGNKGFGVYVETFKGKCEQKN